MSRLVFDSLKKVEYNEIREGYKCFGPSLTKITHLICLKSSLDYPVFISFDGINDHIYLDPGETFKHNLILSVGTKIYYKMGPYGEPSMGALYLTILYGE